MSALTNLTKQALSITRRIHRNQLYAWIMAVTTAIDASGGGLGNVQSVAKASTNRLLDATAENLAALKPGSSVFVADTKSRWFWDPLATTAGDNKSVCQPTAITGAGRFFRESIPTFSAEWGAVAVWGIDPAAGNDENDGTVSPVATMAEIVRRIGYRGRVGQIVDVTITGTLPSTDPYRVVFHFGVNGMWRTHGTTTVAYTNNTAGFSARTVMVPSTNTPNDLTDALIPTGTWAGAGLLGKRIRSTTGASAGAYAWTVKDLTGAKARATPAVVPNLAPGANILPTVVSYAVGDQFVVETLTATVSRLEIDYTFEDQTVQGAGFLQFALFDSLTFSAAPLSVCSSNGGGVAFLGCDVSSVTAGPGTAFTFVACKHAGTSVTQIGSATMAVIHAGYVTARMNVSFGCTMILTGGTLAQGVPLARVRLGGTLRCSSACAFDSTAEGLQIETGGFLRCDASFTGETGLLWGAGNTSSGLAVAAGCRVGINALAGVTITGARDFAVAGATSGRPFDNATGAYVAAVAFSWAALAAATPGGFGGRFADPVTGAEIGLQ